MRMLSQRRVIENVPEVLVKCRTGNDLYRRRGGISYALLDVRLQLKFYRNGMLTVPEFVRNVVCRVPIQLFPTRVRSMIYGRLLRD